IRTRIKMICLPLNSMRWRRPGSLRTKRPGIWLGMQQSLLLSTGWGSLIVASGSGISACRRSGRRDIQRPLTTVFVISLEIYIHECPPTVQHLIFNAGSVFSHCPFHLRGTISDALLPTPARITPALNAHGRNRDVSEFFKTCDLLGIALGLIHVNPVDSDTLEENYDDMPALEDDLTENYWCNGLKSKL
ncbi:hypothetical protein B0H14DRAFT_2855269, partial [Mycena olivaceomarginata]